MAEHAEAAAPSAALSSRDPWAHRRGEPRVFAMCWLIYVTLTVTGSVRWVVQSTSEISPLSYGPSARIMLIVLATGAMVLWPMVRLSQAAPRRSRLNSAVLGDMAIVLIPSWLVILPLRFVAGWPVDVVGAIAAIFGAWVYLLGGVLVLALSAEGAARENEAGSYLMDVDAPSRSEPEAASDGETGRVHVSEQGATAVSQGLEMHRQPTPFPLPLGGGLRRVHPGHSRWAWMLGILALVGAGLLLHGVLRAREMTADVTAPSWLTFLSPLSAIPALTGRGLWGPQNPVGVGQWIVLIATFGAGLFVWSLAGVRTMKGTSSQPE